jgi:CTP:molybdopterin cytidylyltransferase MocA
MLQQIMIVSAGGTTLFLKDFARTDVQPDIFGAIITAMVDFSIQRTGMSVSYIELPSHGVAIVHNSQIKVIVVVDAADGSDFASLIANELLRTFSIRFATELENKVSSSDAFVSFNGDIPEVLLHTVRPIMEHLAAHRGVALALLTGAQGSTILHATQDLDKYATLAHHTRLLDLAMEVMVMHDRADMHVSTSLRNDKTTLSLHRIERCSFVVVTKNALHTQECKDEVEVCISLLRKVLATASSLTGTG